jgi:hypothetical protein
LVDLWKEQCKGLASEFSLVRASASTRTVPVPATTHAPAQTPQFLILPFINVALATLVDSAVGSAVTPDALTVDLCAWLRLHLRDTTMGDITTFRVHLQPRLAVAGAAGADDLCGLFHEACSHATAAAAAAAPVVAPTAARAADARRSPATNCIRNPPQIDEKFQHQLLPPRFMISPMPVMPTWSAAWLKGPYPGVGVTEYTHFGADVHHTEAALRGILCDMLGSTARDIVLAATVNDVAFDIGAEDRAKALKHIINHFTIGMLWRCYL